MFVTVVENYTRWNSQDIQHWLNDYLGQSYERWTKTGSWGVQRQKTIQLHVFDWKNAKGSHHWVNPKYELDFRMSAEIPHFEVQLADPTVMSDTPMSMLSCELTDDISSTSHIELKSHHYAQFMTRIVRICRGYWPVDQFNLLEAVTGHVIRVDPTVNKEHLKAGLNARHDFRRMMLYQLNQDAQHLLGIRYYEKFMSQMKSKYEKLRAVNRKTGFPVEVLEGVKAQLRQDLEWLESIQPSTKKIQRPETTFKKFWKV